MQLDTRNLDDVMRPTRMLVAGVGGAGCNALNHMLRVAGSAPDALALHTDQNVLASSLAPRRFQMGASVTNGLSTGGDAKLGRIAAESDESNLRDLFAEHHLIVFLVGLGGGTGSGAIPVLARLAREMGVLTLVIATQPFLFEGDERRRNADIAMADLKGVADAILTFPNERLFAVVQAGGSLGKAFQLADRYLVDGILAIWQLMNQRGLIHLDFADVQRLVRHSGGLCTLATVEMSAVEGAQRATEALLASPLLDRGQVVNRAHGAILGITAGPELSLDDIQALVRDLRGAVARPDLRFAMGVAVEPAMAGKLRLLLLITEEWRDLPGATPAPNGELDLGGDPGEAARPRVVQADLDLDTGDSSKGRFKGVEATVVEGQDLDVPTFIRKGIRIGL